MAWEIVLGVLGGVALTWLLLVAALLVARPRGGLLEEAVLGRGRCGPPEQGPRTDRRDR
jgi:hypothetical protein